MINVEKYRKIAILLKIVIVFVYIYLYATGPDLSENENLKSFIIDYAQYLILPNEGLYNIFMGVALTASLLFYVTAWLSSKSSVLFFCLMYGSYALIVVTDPVGILPPIPMEDLLNTFSTLLDGFILCSLLVSNKSMTSK